MIKLPRPTGRALGRERPQGSQQMVSFSLTVIEHESNFEFDDPAPAKESFNFVLVHEKEDRGWWLPGGGVDAGQTLSEAAIREAAEEAGCHILLTGVLRIEIGSGRLRVLWHAKPVDASVPLKSVPDKESRGAAWATFAHTMKVCRREAPDVEHCWLRGLEPLQFFGYLCRPNRLQETPIAPPDFIISERLDGSPAPVWEGPGDPPRAFYDTTIDVRLASLLREDGTGASFRFYSDDPNSGLPSVRVQPGRSVFQAAEVLADASSQSKLLGIACFAHVLDVARNAASIQITFVAMAGASGPAWQAASAFPDAEQPMLERISSGQVYPTCLLSESEGSNLDTADACSEQVAAIQAFFS